ncbi:DUF192 domain-containing protein [Actimicrobium antarcticum]|uniref:DUF192 domain-containing protein n=1 Tax=Actimicrobium antarcticum TaxID=1051899 RepID=A0ABP7TPX3_9BURK
MKPVATPQIPGLQIEIARSFWQRLIGLLGRRRLADDAGLLLVPCNNIHTAFMRFTIDAVFIDRAGVVLEIVPKLQPFRAAVVRAAHGCLELSDGGAARYGLHVGQRLWPTAAQAGTPTSVSTSTSTPQPGVH